MTARSFEPNDRNTVVVPNGARVHRDHLAQSDVLRKGFYEVCPAVWCYVGNGLSKKTGIPMSRGGRRMKLGKWLGMK